MKKILFTLILILTLCLSHAQTLYSTAYQGGPSDAGTICKLDLVTNTLTAAFSFDGATGTNPQASLVQASDGKLYGMTSGGGSSNYGVIFSYDPSTATYAKLLDFDGTNGAIPYGSLVRASDGKLYGMTFGGGGSYAGVIFSYDPGTSIYSKPYDFDVTNGGYPTGSLMRASDGKLYGMTNEGGSSNGGVIFSYDPATATYAKLHDFNLFTNGVSPWGSLVQASDGKLYGMTTYGGSNGFGVIFSYNPATGAYAKLLDFNNSNGSDPYGNLVQASDGKLYGMTSEGGSVHEDIYGVIFSYDPATATYAKLHDFDNTNGGRPTGSLIQASNGKLYGMTEQGGSGGSGVSFSFDPVTGTYTKLADFTGDNGNGPLASFVEGCTTTTWYRDADGDGFGDLNNSTTGCSSTIPPGYVADSTDCDDNDKTVYPGAPELCDGKDNNCNGTVDEGCKPVKIIAIDRVITEGNENTKTMWFEVLLSARPIQAVTVDYTTQNGTAAAGTDYKATAGTLTFLPGQRSKQIGVTIYGDELPEPNKTFRLVLSNPVNASLFRGVIYGLIVNDDGSAAAATASSAATATIIAGKAIKLSPNPATGSVNVSLSGYTSNVTIQLMDMKGKMLLQKKVQTSAKMSLQSIDISPYTNGVYLVVVTDETGDRKTQKLVISR